MRQHLRFQVFLVLLPLALLSACVSEKPAIITNAQESALPGATTKTDTYTPTPETTGTVLPHMPSPPLAYQVLSPTRIRAGDYTFEVTAIVRTDELFFQVHSEFPASIEKQFEKRGVPAAAKAVNVRLRDLPNNLKILGGGGGDSVENGMNAKNQGVSYCITPPLNIGDKVHVSALVTFDKSIGIPKPVPFEYDVVVEKAMNPS